jgi:hypothetical protein
MRFLILALALLAGCQTLPQRGPVPTELLQDCLVGSRLGVATNAELSDSVLKLSSALRLCNIDKRKLREWADEEATRP